MDAFSNHTEPTLLVVDDEADVLFAIRQTLENSGYILIETTDPRRVLEIVKAEGPIDLIIMDLFMPAMDGARLLKECRRLRPDLKVVLTSGMTSDAELRRWRMRGEIIVAKPWLDHELINAVHLALRRGRSAVAT